MGIAGLCLDAPSEVKDRCEVIRVSELIGFDGSRGQIRDADAGEFDGLVVSGEMSVRDVLREMQQVGCDCVGVDISQDDDDIPQGDGTVVLSKEDVLHGLLRELDFAEDRLTDLQYQAEGTLSDQLDMVHEGMRSLVEYEKNKLEVAIENMNEGLIILDRSGQAEKANPSAKGLLGLAKTDSLQTLTEAMDRIGFRELLVTEDNDRTNASGEFNLGSTEGRILQMRWTQMGDEWGHFLGYVVIVRDMTEEMAAERAKTEFIAAISHELRTPLTSIQNSVSNILVGVTGKITRKTRQYLHAMKSDCHRFADLINDLLDMAKLEAGSMPINRRVTNMATIISETIDESVHEAHAREIALICEIDGHISPVYADSQRICQVLRNLIDNAIKHAESAGQITVRSYDSGDDVVTVVEDTGVGISADLHDHIFSKFYQIERQAGAGSKGSGLGLAICNGIIAVHGGSIWVESEENQGSRFYFSLPKTDPFIVLYKHLTALAKRVGKKTDDFALMIVGFDVPLDRREELKGAAGSIINELLTESDHFLLSKDDLAIQTEDFEAIFVVNNAQKERIDAVKQKIRKIVGNRLRKNCGDLPILPMLSTGIYTGDSLDVSELEKAARRQAEKMF